MQPDILLIKILHLSDVHINLEYTEGLNAGCGEPLCCHPLNNTTRPVAGYWGDYGCDLPLSTANNLVEHLSQHKDEFDWIYWTGDSNEMYIAGVTFNVTSRISLVNCTFQNSQILAVALAEISDNVTLTS